MRASRKYLAPLSALVGAGLFAWLILRIGPDRVFDLWRAARPILPIIAALTGLRYLLQAAGWRLATRADERPGWGPTLAGVVAGEAAGYVAGGMLAREPIKFLFVRDRVRAHVAVSGAAVERLASFGAGATIILVGLTTLAIVRAPHMAVGGIAGAVVTLAVSVRLVQRLSPRRIEGTSAPPPSHLRRVLASSVDVVLDLWRDRRPALAAIAALGLAQEAVNVLEGYVVLMWIGAAPALPTVIAFEGVSRALNILAQFVPGRVGVSEATATFVAGTVHLNPAHGLGLALARRARSLLWAIVGLALLIARNVLATVRYPTATVAGPGRLL
jgi:Lysylphosphatidylglycerol synthase TM region